MNRSDHAIVARATDALASIIDACEQEGVDTNALLAGIIRDVEQAPRCLRTGRPLAWCQCGECWY